MNCLVEVMGGRRGPKGFRRGRTGPKGLRRTRSINNQLRVPEYVELTAIDPNAKSDRPARCSHSVCVCRQLATETPRASRLSVSNSCSIPLQLFFEIFFKQLLIFTAAASTSTGGCRGGVLHPPVAGCVSPRHPPCRGVCAPSTPPLSRGMSPRHPPCRGGCLFGTPLSRGAPPSTAPCRSGCGRSEDE